MPRADAGGARFVSTGVLDYGDLVVGPSGRGVPWVSGGTDPAVGLDCKGLAWHALRRVFPGIPRPAVLGLPSADDEDGGAAAWDAYVEAMSGAWATVPLANRVGDLVRSAATDPPHGPHLSVLVDVPRQRVLTTSRRYGAQLAPLGALRGIVEVLRYQG